MCRVPIIWIQSEYAGRNWTQFQPNAERNILLSVLPLIIDLPLLYIVNLIMIVHLCSVENIYWNSVVAGSVLSNVETDNRETSSDWYSFVWEERAHLTRTRRADEHLNACVSTVDIWFTKRGPRLWRHVIVLTPVYYH